MAASLVLVLLWLGVIVGIGPNYGIDFKGGSDIILHFKKEVSPEQVRDAATQAGFTDAQVQRFGPTERNQFLVQTKAVSVVNQEKISAIEAKLKADKVQIKTLSWSEEQPDRLDLQLKAAAKDETLKAAATSQGLESVAIERAGQEEELRYVMRFQDLQSRVRNGFAKAMPDAFDPANGLDRLETVGARVGAQLRGDGITAVLLALLWILVYIALRFDMRYAPGAVVALTHDVIFSLGILTVLRLEINLPILAAMLTIVGYSLNDTIVVFDRIRENYTAGRGGSNLVQIVNTSLNETLSRTLNTSITTLIAVAIIAALGSGLIQDFAITLIIGVVVGTYSSIFIAAPILLIMDAWLTNRRQAQAILDRARKAEGGESSEEPTDADFEEDEEGARH